jgi:hypothetical protein
MEETLSDIPPDPSPDIYKAMDEAGLGITKFSQARPMTRILTEIRMGIAVKLRDYIKKRDTVVFAAGVLKGKEDAEKERTKTIPVQNG